MKPGVALLLLLAGCASAARVDPAADARRRDTDAIAAAAEIDGPKYASQWIVVQDGAVAAAAASPDTAVRAATRPGSSPAHRYVFRAADRGSRSYRLAYLPDGGIVAGRAFLASLGLESIPAAGHPPLIRRRTGGVSLDLARTPRLALAVSTSDGVQRAMISAAFDPDFDGGLLLTEAAASQLGLVRWEVPGDGDVQVVLGRPFNARRAFVAVSVEALGASGSVEALWPAAPGGR